jgi:hypothetical protein
MPAPFTTLDQVSCLSATVCVAVGETSAGGYIARTANSGASWTAVATPDTGAAGDALTSISCPTSSVCYAAGNGNVPFEVSTNAGVTWAGAGTPPHEGYLACATAQLCYLDGGSDGATYIVGSADGGAQWSQVNPSEESFDGLSCPSSTLCFAFGESNVGNEVIYRITDNGAGWTSSTVPSGYVMVRGVACPTTNECLAVAEGGPQESTDGGATWQEASSSGMTVTPSFNGLTCSPTTCFAYGFGQGEDIYSTPSPTPAAPTVSSLSPASGSTAGGTTVTITGANFVPGATSVTFGSKPATAVSCPSSTTCLATAPAGSAGGVAVVVTASGQSSAIGSGSTFTYQAPTPPPPATHGYWLVGADGGIFSFGSAQFYGSTGSLRLQRPVVGIAPTAGRTGYWLVASDGGVFAFGGALYKGSIPGLGLAPAGSGGSRELNAPIVGLVPSVDGNGYFMVGADGGVFSFGDAAYEGSCPGIGGCSGTAVSVVPDATGDGYWIVTTTGHVYAFGDAENYGAPGPQFVPVTSAAATPDGKGYWVLFSNGVVGTYGDAVSYGAPAGLTGGSDPAASIFPTSDGKGYWVATAAGKVYSYGDAPADGDMSGTHLNAPIIAASGS